MIQTLQHRLTFLFTAATGLILTLILGITWFYQWNQTHMQRNTQFQNQLLNLTGKLDLESDISDNWLARSEYDNRLIIHIEENQRPLFFSGSWIPDTDRDTLIGLAKKDCIRRGRLHSGTSIFLYHKTVFHLSLKRRTSRHLYRYGNRTCHRTRISFSGIACGHHPPESFCPAAGHSLPASGSPWDFCTLFVLPFYSHSGVKTCRKISEKADGVRSRRFS